MRAAGDRQPGASRRAGRHHHRDRRHGRRHRVAAVPRGGPPGAPRRRAATTSSSCTSRWCPTSRPSGELKTKPTQHSVAALRQVGIQPDGLVLRADREIPDGDQAQDLADVRRRHRGRAPPPSTRRASTTSPRCCTARASTPTSSAGSACRFRDVDWTRLGRAAAPGAPAPSTTSRSPWSASTSTCPTPTSRSPRRCAPAGSTTTPRSRIRWVASDECETEAGAPAGARRRRRGAACPAASACAASRASSARCAGPASSRCRRSGICLGPAVHGHRVRPQRRRHRRRVARPSSTRDTAHPVIATMEEQKAFVEGAGDLGGTMRLGLLPGRAGRGLASSREAYGADARSTSATATATRSTTRYRDAARGGRAGRSPAPRPDGTLVEFVELPARRAPVLRLDPGAPGVPVAPAPGPPAVRRARRGRHRRGSGRAGWSRSSARAAETAARRRDAGRADRADDAELRRPARAAAGRADRAGLRRAWSGTSSATPSTSARPARSRREYVRHPGAVARRSPSTTRTGSLLIQQYRHPVGSLRVGAAGRAARRRRASRRASAAARELPRRPTSSAGTWDVLADYFSSPGGLDEALRIFLARDLSAVPAGRPAQPRRRGARHAGALGRRSTRSATPCSPAGCTTRRS